MVNVTDDTVDAAISKKSLVRHERWFEREGVRYLVKIEKDRRER